MVTWLTSFAMNGSKWLSSASQTPRSSPGAAQLKKAKYNGDEWLTYHASNSYDRHDRLLEDLPLTQVGLSNSWARARSACACLGFFPAIFHSVEYCASIYLDGCAKDVVRAAGLPWRAGRLSRWARPHR